MSLFGRSRRGSKSGGGRVDCLVVGLGNPGSRYSASRHNIGFDVVAELASRWEMPKPKQRFSGSITEGAITPGGPRVALLCPETFMNRAGESAGPVRGSLKLPLDRVIVCHDEIDLPFGEVRTRMGGGLAGHNGLKSLSQGLGGSDFWRVRVGVGRPESSDPEIVSAYVLGRFQESPDQVRELVESAAGATETLVGELTEERGSDAD